MAGLRTPAAVTVTTAGTRVSIYTQTSPMTLYRVVRIEADKANTGDIYVGDVSVSSSRYTAKLTAGQSFTISASHIDPARIYVDTSVNASKVQLGLVN